MITPQAIQALIKKFSGFPGVGPKQAARFVFYLLNLPQKDKVDLAGLITNLSTIKLCPLCNFPTDNTLCAICKNEARDKRLICIVERSTDLLSIEKSGYYKGMYYVVGGNLFDNKKINLSLLKKRILELLKNNSEPIELILALNPTTEGEATTLYIEKELGGLNIKITKLAQGLPTGAELEYTDSTTLQSAIQNRKQIKK
ncbi:recombination protein RecR [Candidatus Parcubacteria bacterium]|nr:MAG: recombination protein RecR [Candidatus Parcubacteria bacterium]